MSGVFSVYSSTNKADRHDIAELVLKVELKIIHPRMQTQVYMYHLYH
jgi:hypothetical protein